MSGRDEWAARSEAAYRQLAAQTAETLDVIYSQALTGMGGVKSVERMAEGYMTRNDGLHRAANALIRDQLIGATATGVATSLGGLITLPLAVSVDEAGNLYSQLRMIAAIAYMGGYDIHSDQVRAFSYACLAGRDAMRLLRDSGLTADDSLTPRGMEKISIVTINAISRAVSLRLVAKAGTRSVSRLGRLVPLAGGVIGGGLDFADTRVIASNAKKMFLGHKINPQAVDTDVA